ncbi:MAG: ThiF family adenylyltransferase [Proteobacteria bacterium]|jgi:molybdopterin/thiamine biosynthesis adenylyltransferase|nr:ThiF family adenylyltransferase [Pseudomonadota bacterium]
MPHLVLHAAAIQAALDEAGRANGVTQRKLSQADDGDLWIVDGTTGTGAVVQTTDQASRAPLVLTESKEPTPVAIGTGESARWLHCTDGDGNPLAATVIPREVDIFDRVRGIFETDVLRQKSVAIVGLGSGGSFVARELAKNGVGRFILVDHDRLEVGNICRHECGLSDVGRLKVNAVGDLIRDRNPGAIIEAIGARVEGTNITELGDRFATVDVIICATDGRPSRLLVNRAAIKHKRFAIYGAVFRRAYGGQILTVIPGLTPCYQCFVNALPEMARDREISNVEAANAIAYSDRPVAIEPGLSTDLLPVGLMMAKIAILQLLSDHPTTLDSLRRDLVAPLHLWINRREEGTDYEQLTPLENDVGSMTILRWYGVHIARHKACPACGDFEGALLKRYSLAPESLDLDWFGAKGKE